MWYVRTKASCSLCRSEGSKLNTSDDMTRSLWRETFGVPFARPGSMFRGNPPQGKLLALTEKYQRGLLAPKQMDVELNSVRVPAIPPNVKLEGDTVGAGILLLPLLLLLP